MTHSNPSSLSSGKRRVKTHGRFYRLFNRKANYLKHADKYSRFVDYTSITCRFSIPIRLPDVICVNVIIYNRDKSNSITTSSIKNISFQQITELIGFNKRFYDVPMLPSYSAIVPSPSLQINSTTDEDDELLIVHPNETNA